MQSKLNYKRTFFVGLAFLSICAFWNMYDSIIPLILQNTFGLGETVTGVLMAMDNVLALFLLPVFGTLSDKVDTPLGKRTPFILAGTVLAVIFMLLLPVADRRQSLVLFVGALFATLLSMGLYRSPAVALMPDRTPNHLRSKANAVINLMGAVGGVYALIMIKLLVGKGERPDYLPLFVSIAAVMVVAVGILLITIRESKLRKELEAQEQPEKTVEAVASEEKGSLPKEVKRSMMFMLLSIFFWFTAYNAVTTAFSRYTKVVWKMEGGSFANCLMVATVAAILSYIPIGQISAKFGRKKTIITGLALFIGAFAAYLIVDGITGKALTLVYVALVLGGFANMLITVNTLPLVLEIGGLDKVGTFTGYYYTATFSAQIATPIIYGIVRMLTGTYASLFYYCPICFILSILCIFAVKHGESEEITEEIIEEARLADD